MTATRATLLALASRVEAATGAEQADMLNAARIAILDGVFAVAGSRLDGYRWRTIIDAEAYESAAMSLVPSGHEWSINWCGNSVASVNRIANYPVHFGHASTPALALTAACLRARAIAGSLPND